MRKRRGLRRRAAEPGALCRAIWADDRATSAAAWRELGRRARDDAWARRLLFDVIEAKLFLAPEAAVPGLRALAEVNAEGVLALLRCGSATSAHVAAIALGREGDKFLRELLGLTEDSQVSARLVGIAGIAEAAAASSQQAVESLGALLQNPAGVVRRAATVALGRARGATCADRAFACLSRALTRGGDAEAAAFAAAALWPAKRRETARLLLGLTESGPSIRKALALAVRELPRHAAARIADLCVCDGDLDVRALIVPALGRWAAEGSAPARRGLERLARDAHPRVRAAAARALAAEPELEARRVLDRLRADRSAVVRSAVAEGLGMRGRGDAYDVLCEMVNDPHTTTRAAAVRSLGTIGRQAEVQNACFDKEPAVRAAAAEALQPTEDTSSVLISLLDDEDAEVRRAAARTAGRCPHAHTPPIWERLMAMATSRSLSGAVAEAVAVALAGDLGRLAAVVFWWPDSDEASEQMWRIAKEARTPEVAEMARAAARLFGMRDAPGDVWQDVAIAWSTLGEHAQAEGASWLGDCAHAFTPEEVAHMHVTVPRVGEDSVVLLAGISRAAAPALRARTPAARERQVARVLHRIDALLALERNRAGWRRIRQIAHQWRAVLEQLAASSASADLRARVISTRIVAGAHSSILVEIRNAGMGTASEISVRVNESRARSVDLPAGATAEVTIPIGDTAAGTSTVRGRVMFRDREGRRDTELEGQVEALEPGGQRPVPNPYVVGKPLGGQSAMFFGRAAELAYVERALESGESGSVVVLVGQRRTGKTSLLRRLEARLGYQYRTAFVDVQGLLVADTQAFFHQLADRALRAGEAETMLSDGGMSSMGSAAGAETVREVADRSDKRTVLLLDEFDDLEAKVASGMLGRDVFAQLRHLMQHSEKVSLVLSGTHRLEALAGEYWSFLLNLATYRRVGCLSREEAQDVLRVPLERLGILYEDAGVARALRLTGRQPYLLQLLGYRLVEQCVESGEAAVRADTVEEVADRVVEQGEIHLRYLWEAAGADGQPALRALATDEEGLTTEELATAARSSPARLNRTLNRLSESELVECEAGRCRLRIGLLGRWLSQV